MSVNNKALEVRDINKRFGGVIALDDVSLHVDEGGSALSFGRKRRRKINAHQHYIGSVPA